jgi:O-antigen ligase
MAQPWKVFSGFPFSVLATLNSHNTYLTVLLRGGVVGMTAFVYLAYISFRTIRRTKLAAVEPFDKVMAVCLLGWLTMFYIASVTAPILSEQRGAAIAGIMFAFIARQYERVQYSLPHPSPVS